MVKVRLADVASARLLNVLPPSVLTCHCTVGVGNPDPAATSVTGLPALATWLVGLVVTATKSFSTAVRGPSALAPE